MDIKILNYPEKYLNILYIAGRNCYGFDNKEIHKITDTVKINFIQKLILKDHYSVLEHINISFIIEDVSRSLMAQLTRHRHASYSIKSQHFVNHKNFKYKELETPYLKKEYKKLMTDINRFYLKCVFNGIPHYIAREVLPNSALTDIVMTCNIRELFYILKIRITLNNTPEIILFSEMILNKLCIIMPEIFNFFKVEKLQ